ncbi:MAG: TrmH family RNA methyltransferase [Gemmatimonadaceae bacterium]
MRLLTLARDLKRRKAREKHRLFVAEGVRAVEELLRSSLTVRGALLAPQLLEAPRGAVLAARLRERGIPVEDVPANMFGSAAETESPQGVLAIGEVPARSFSSVDSAWNGLVLVLDALQDPGNVGTILRSAAALGIAATVALPGTVDLWNAKVVRSGMGAHFRHLAFSSTWDELDSFRREADAALFAADVGGEAVDRIDVPRRVALVVGNEGAGLSGEARARAQRTVSIPITSDVESLNVAVATGILLYSLRQ